MILICEKAYFKNGKQKDMIMCRESGMLCAHVYYCSQAMSWRQRDSAKDCPGRTKEEQN